LGRDICDPRPVCVKVCEHRRDSRCAR
jgi:hypothetical protein